MAHQYSSFGPPPAAAARPARPAASSRPRSASSPAPTPVIVAAVTGAALFVLFTVTDGAGLLPFGAVVAYWVLFAVTHLVLGVPGRDWPVPIQRAHLIRLARWGRRGAVTIGCRVAGATGRALRAAALRLPTRAGQPSRQT